MKNSIKLFLVLSLIFSGQLMASKLTAPKDAGVIGEQSNGYIGFVTKASDEVKELVKTANKKRKDHYKAIAKKQKLSLSEVEKVGGKKTIEKTKPGHYIKLAGEGWTKKK